MFHKWHVKDIIRLNKKMYNAKRFTDNGFCHHDLYFIDGSNPPESILNKFLTICEERLKPENDDFEKYTSPKNGVLSVHCKAGLGRTGTLIAAYIMKHYRWPANEIIAWLRICRPGSVIGPQQIYLTNMQNELFRRGEEYHRIHKNKYGQPSNYLKHFNLLTSKDHILLNSNTDNKYSSQDYSRTGYSKNRDYHAYNGTTGREVLTTAGTDRVAGTHHHHTTTTTAHQTTHHNNNNSIKSSTYSTSPTTTNKYSNVTSSSNYTSHQTTNHSNAHRTREPTLQNSIEDKKYQQVYQEQTAVSKNGISQGDRLRAVKTMQQKSNNSKNSSSKEKNRDYDSKVQWFGVLGEILEKMDRFRVVSRLSCTFFLKILSSYYDTKSSIVTRSRSKNENHSVKK